MRIPPRRIPRLRSAVFAIAASSAACAAVLGIDRGTPGSVADEDGSAAGDALADGPGSGGDAKVDTGPCSPDLSSDEKIKIYDRGVAFNGENGKNGMYKLLVSYRSGDMYVPKVDNTEALRKEVDYFVHCLEHNEEPHNNGEAGLQVVRLLEASGKSLKNNGRRTLL